MLFRSPRFAVLCLFQCFEEKEYQTESKWNEINWRSYFWNETHLMDLYPTSEDTGASHEGGGRAHPPRARPLPRGALMAPLTCFFCLYNSIYPKTSKTHNRSGVPPPEGSVATKNQSRPVPAPWRRGESSPVAIFIIPAATTMRRE